MYAYYPYQFEYQPQVHLHTDYPPHHSYPYSQYQDRNDQQETQMQQIQGQQQQEQGQYSSQIGQHQQQQFYQAQQQPVSTPGTSIDTPTPGFSTCSTSASTGAGASSMPYYTPPTQPDEMIFTDPLVRPQQSPTNPDHNLSGPDVIGMEGHYSYEYDEYEWTGEQQQQQQQQASLPLSSAYPSPSLSQPRLSQNSSRSSPQPQVPFDSSFESSSPSQQQQQHEQQQHAQPQSQSQPRSQSQSHIPPPRLTRSIRREREQPFRAFHPYANNNPRSQPPPPTPAGSGEKEKGTETLGGIIVEGDANVSGSVSSSRPALILAASSTLTPPAAAQKAESQPQRQSQSQSQPLPQPQPQPQHQHQPQSASQHQSKIQSQPEPEVQPQTQPHSETRQRPQKPVPTIVTSASPNSKPSISKTPSAKNNSASTTSSSTSNLPSASVAPSSSRHTITRTSSPNPTSTPPTIIGLFGSYPLSRSQALPGPTCAPETSSSVMRLVLTPGALAHGGNGHHSGGKKDKSEKGSMSTNGVVVDHNPTSVSVNMAMAPTTFNFSPNSSSSFPAVPVSDASGNASTTTNGTHNTFNTPTLGLNVAPNSSQSTMSMAIRKPRMACYFCRKRKIACGPGPVAIALAKQVQQAQIQIQQQHQHQHRAQLEQQGLQFQEQQSSEGGSSSMVTIDDSSSKIKFPFEGGDGSISSPTSPLNPSSPPSISTSPTMSTLTPAQLLSHPQALTGDEGPCNQCARRGLSCDRPTESKRGVRKGKSKKEKEKEARERETKELSPSKKGVTTAGEKEKEKERGSPGKNHVVVDDDDKVGDDEEEGGDVNEEVMNEDLDIYMDGSDETDGYGKRVGGDFLKIENEDTLPSSSSLGTASAPPQQLQSSATVIPEQKTTTTSSHKTQKHSSGRGRGRPPKHPKNPLTSTSNPTPTSSSTTHTRHQPSSTSGVKGSLKWTTSTAAAAGKKNKATGKFKGKNEKDVIVDDDVPAADVKVEREVQQVGVVPTEREDADDDDDDDGMDEDFDDDNVEDDDKNKNGENEIDVRDGGYPSIIMPHTSDPSQTEERLGLSHVPSVPAMYVSQSPNLNNNVSSPVSSVVPPSYGAHADAHSYTPTTPPFSETVGQSDSHSYYPQSHPHTPIVVEQPPQEQQPCEHAQLGYSADEMDVPSPVVNTVYSGAYQNADIHNPHEAMYSLEYAIAPTQHQQEQQQSIIPVSQPEHVSGVVATYPSFGVQTNTDLYSMNGHGQFGTEIPSYDMATTSWSIAEGYDVQMNDGYMVETVSGMAYVVDGQTETQVHEYGVIGSGYDSYDYGYAYTGQYAV